MEDYKTVLISDETELEIKKSRFINLVFHIEAEAEAEAILAEIRKTMPIGKFMDAVNRAKINCGMLNKNSPQ